MSLEKTRIFDIEKFAVHDGPGIRTVVFMKGCPLHCIWCHNPESQSFQPELLYQTEKCINCRNCAAACPEVCHSFKNGNTHVFDRKKCTGCGKCTENCLTDALRTAGREMTVDEVMAEVMKDRIFYENSGGGLTLSGGEPLAHFDFTFELLKQAKSRGIHTAVETCGFADWKQIEKLLNLTDLWLWDIKASPEKHKQLTGADSGRILTNLKRLSAADVAIILRCPMIPGVNDEDSHLLQIATLANELKSVQGIDLEPYHPLGEGKKSQLGRESVFHSDFVSESDKIRWQTFIAAHTAVPCRFY